jgi:hypothetical protein
LDNIAIFFPKRPVPNECGKTEIKKFRERSSFGSICMEESCAVESPKEVGEVVQKDTFEIGILLVSANDIWCCSKRIIEGWRFQHFL